MISFMIEIWEIIAERKCSYIPCLTSKKGKRDNLWKFFQIALHIFFSRHPFAMKNSVK